MYLIPAYILSLLCVRDGSNALAQFKEALFPEYSCRYMSDTVPDPAGRDGSLVIRLVD